MIQFLRTALPLWDRKVPKSSGIHVFSNTVMVLVVAELLNSSVKDFDTKKLARFIVCSHYNNTETDKKRDKMDCIIV